MNLPLLIFSPSASSTSRPRPVEQPCLPQAERRASQLSTESSSCTSTLGRSGWLMGAWAVLLMGVLSRISMPVSPRIFRHAFCRSSSRKGTTLSKVSTIVTLAPSLAKIMAYSRPMIPAPWTTMCFGRYLMPPIVSESNTPSRPKSAGGNRFDLEPVAISITLHDSVRGSEPETGQNLTLSTAMMVPAPLSTSTLFEDSCVLASVCVRSVDLSSTFLHCSQVVAPARAASRRHFECVPVGPPVIVALGSMMPTRHPRDAASVAAFMPTGPAPSTRKSKAWASSWNFFLALRAATWYNWW
mmetsp:Transcript_101371/g.261998  ORF Transcript_101371/g.261998 Transcript_101371/m.261998 type:complete len:299 (+) Transcript_101371:83-979(+)